VMTYSALVDTLYCRPFRSFNPSGILHSTRITFLQRSHIFVRFTRVQNGDETQDWTFHALPNFLQLVSRVSIGRRKLAKHVHCSYKTCMGSKGVKIVSQGVWAIQSEYSALS
jgi:hypothetical protein